MPIKKFVVDMLADFLEGATSWLNDHRELFATLFQIVKSLLEVSSAFFSGDLVGVWKEVGEIPCEIKEARERVRKQDEPEDMLQEFWELGSPKNWPGFAQRQDPLAGAAAAQLAMPALFR